LLLIFLSFGGDLDLALPVVFTPFLKGYATLALGMRGPDEEGILLFFCFSINSGL
jgi:hypothetical protein